MSAFCEFQDSGIAISSALHCDGIGPGEARRDRGERRVIVSRRKIMIHGFGIAPKLIQEREGKRKRCILPDPQKCLGKEWAEKMLEEKEVPM
jgi:hypothetical protein